MMRAVIWVISAASLFGCGGSFSNNARRALYVASESLVRIDGEIAVRYENEAAQALLVSQSADEYRRRMSEWDELEVSLRAARLAMLAAEAGIDVYDHEGRKLELESGMSCAVLVFEDLFERIHDATGEAPNALMTAASALGAYAGECRDERFAH